MINQFSRTELLLGSESLEKLKNSKVIIFGIGGVGGYTAEALARCAVGKIDIVDNDIISKTNINRQIIALNSTIEKYKVDVAKQRLLDINPELNIEEFKIFYNNENSNMFDFSKYDYIIDCIDSTKSKIEIIINAKLAKTKVISSMGTGNKLNPLMFEITDISKTSVCPLAKIMRSELKKRNIKDVKVLYSKEIPKKPLDEDMKNLLEKENMQKRQIPASISFVPSAAGLIIAAEVVKDLISFTD